MKSHQAHYAYLKIQELTKSCRLNGLPVTPQRQAVLEALARRNNHPSADELFEDVKLLIPGISRTTVYRVLETLVKIGVAQKISTHESRARFDADTSRHAHLICVGCGLLIDFNGCEDLDLMRNQRDNHGFHLLDYSIQFTGLCPDCLSGMAPPRTSGTLTSTSNHKEE
ncbi:Fur family transcriptional regulator [Trichloromonas sp.]|uniref:Fur family transcriptional regulator n=1 Tax=Trichloromonas sp. TaxID=3069249 RepID=UPI002A389DBA|nr:transcriptional repressor [Trichloromonas sp.]